MIISVKIRACRRQYLGLIKNVAGLGLAVEKKIGQNKKILDRHGSTYCYTRVCLSVQKFFVKIKIDFGQTDNLKP